MKSEDVRAMNFELVNYVVKRMKGAARDLSESGSDDLSDILFVHAADIDEEVCKLKNSSLCDSFNEVRQQGYDKALQDICEALVQKYGTESEVVEEIKSVCYILRKGEEK